VGKGLDGDHRIVVSRPFGPPVQWSAGPERQSNPGSKDRKTSRPLLKSLVSFHADGTSMASDQGGVVLPGVSSSGVGAWTQLDWHTFVYTNKKLISDLNGT